METLSTGDFDTTNLYFVTGCFCCSEFIYADFPGCIGCSGRGEFLCCTFTNSCGIGRQPLSCGLTTGEEDICTLGCYCCERGLKVPQRCCKIKTQACCCADFYAFPPVDEHPTACGYYFLSCYPKAGCCTKFSELM